MSYFTLGFSVHSNSILYSAADEGFYGVCVLGRGLKLKRDDIRPAVFSERYYNKKLFSCRGWSVYKY